MTSANNDMPPQLPGEDEPSVRPDRDVLDFINETAMRISDADVDEHLHKVLDQAGYRSRQGDSTRPARSDAGEPPGSGRTGGSTEVPIVPLDPSEVGLPSRAFEDPAENEDGLDYVYDDDPAYAAFHPGGPRELALADQPPGTRRPAAGAPGEIKIGLWGAPQSGKTTFLAALRHALDIAPTDGRWAIYPLDAPSENFMVRTSRNLVADHQFPAATAPGEMTTLRWQLRGDLAGSQFDRRKLRRRAPMASEFDLSLTDVSGKAYGDSAEQWVPIAVIDSALDHLASADGLLYLLDPISERDSGNSMEYLNRTIAALSRRKLEDDQLFNRYLPHHIAVCITKLDHPEVFQQARSHGLVTPGPDGRPQVLSKAAKTLFGMLCDGTFWAHRYESGSASASFVRYELERYFHPDRIQYFATSAIGFFQQPERDPAAGQSEAPGFSPDDYVNIYRVDHGERIRGSIAPINVLEPLLGLRHGISGMARTPRLLRSVPSGDRKERRRASARPLPWTA